MSVINTYEQVLAADRDIWREWLVQYHSIAKGVWLVYHKKASGQPSVSYAEAVEEALCFGWIDSTMRPVDEQRYMQLFTPRKSGSEWSGLNKERVARMIEQGKMTKAGMKKIDESKKDGTWKKLEQVEAMILPEDLAKRMSRSKKAMAYFESLKKTNKKYLLHWLNTAKRPETRQKRIDEIYEALKQEQMPARFR